MRTHLIPTVSTLPNQALHHKRPSIETPKNVPVLVVHGDMDTTMVFEASKTMVEHAKAKGVDATWLPVAGGMHTDAWAQPGIIAQIFDFFDAHRTKAK
jgi:hypothetical protein